MKYYARKVTNQESISIIQYTKSFCRMPTDILKDEFRTTNRSLSFWECDDIENEDNVTETLLAMFLADNKFDSLSMIFISEHDIKKLNKELIQDDSKTGLVGGSKKHYNLEELDFFDIYRLIRLYRSYLKPEKASKYVKCLERDEVANHIEKLMKDCKFNHNDINMELASAFQKRAKVREIIEQNGYSFEEKKPSMRYVMVKSE